jgi:hypothetical protein
MASAACCCNGKGIQQFSKLRDTIKYFPLFYCYFPQKVPKPNEKVVGLEPNLLGWIGQLLVPTYINFRPHCTGRIKDIWP